MSSYHHLSGLNQDGKEISLKDYAGKAIVLYFYPKDDTPGCTKEACDFRDSILGFRNLNAVVLGVSKDSPASHKKFIEKYELPFDLISDEDLVWAQALDVWRDRSMYGRIFKGIERSTFLLNGEGEIVQEWRKVKVPGHIEALKKALESLSS